jgi:energy-coupling factor transport system ATP-binding protein
MTNAHFPRSGKPTLGGALRKCSPARPGTIGEVIAPAPPAHRGGALQPSELAQASVMAALCAVTAIISVVVPFAAGLALLGTVPMGLLAYRYRLRVLLAAVVAAGMIAFLIAGLGGFLAVVNSAYIGGLTGIIKRRRRGTPTVIVSALIAGVIFGAANVAALAVMFRLRHLIFAAMTANAEGLASFLARIHLQGLAAGLKHYFALGMHQWPWVLLGYSVLMVLVVSLIGWWALSRVLERMRGVPDVHKLDAPAADGNPDVAVGPVPVRLDKVRYRYPGASQDALREVSVDLRVGEHVAITGANGSGKTTLMLILAGREPTSGTVARPGAVGLGKLGGTAVVLQHPESQVLGTRVADDVVWGLPPGTNADVDRLLSEVGLEGFGERDTGSLSGGELQRLALAAALAREPAMLIADEVTSMVDQQGRDALLSVLSGLTKRHRTALVHITHFDNEAASADRTINLSNSPDNTEMAETTQVPARPVAVNHRRKAPTLELIGVGHEYGRGTPWAKVALRDVSFVVEHGDGVLIHGGNGSGKSTLAWIMAGLTVPTAGVCLVDGRPTHEQVGTVALSFQAARLQLMRSRVDLEVASAAGFSHREHERVVAALSVVGLDPTLAKRRIDQLSGGQMRRVVLAGLLARSPRALILDEPLAGLDAASQRGLLRLLEDLRRERGLTVVVISNDFAGLEDLCPRILHLHDGVLESVPAAAGGMS